jgi:hypothetical protein
MAAPVIAAFTIAQAAPAWVPYVGPSISGLGFLNKLVGNQYVRETQLLLEDKREEMQVLQMKLQYLQQKDSQLFQKDLAQFGADKQKELQEYVQECNFKLQKDSHSFLAWKWQEEKALQEDLAKYARETQLILAIHNREASGQLMKEKFELDNWPLNLSFSQIAESFSGRMPLRVIIAPPDVNYDRFANLDNDVNRQKLPPLEKGLCSGLRQFVHNHYSSHHHTHRVVHLLDGAWCSNMYRGGASIQALYSKLKSESILILQSVVDGDYLNFEYTFWSNGSEPISQSLPRYKFVDALYDSAKERARAWKIQQDLLKKLEEDPNNHNQIDDHNLAVLENEERLLQAGVDISKIKPRYIPADDDFDKLREWLVKYHSLILALCTDIYYLGQANITPILPRLLPELYSTEIDPKIITFVLTSYEQIIDYLSADRSSLIPDLYLDLAHSFQSFSDHTYTSHCLLKSIQALLRIRQPTIKHQDLTACLVSLESCLTHIDYNYAKKVNDCLDFLEINYKLNLTNLHSHREIEIIYPDHHKKSENQYEPVSRINRWELKKSKNPMNW